MVLLLEKNAKKLLPVSAGKIIFQRTSQELGNQDCFNLGLAHGVPAIITILGMIYEKGIAADTTLTLIDRSVAWMLTLKNEPETGLSSMYPSLVGMNNEALHGKQSRLGWCYGDLSIAVALWNTGHRTQNQQYRQAAYDIFEHTVKHRDKKNGSVNDACICHGSAGIAQIFHRASRPPAMHCWHRALRNGPNTPFR